MDWANNRALFCQLVECVCMSVSLSASVYSAGWYRVCISRCWLPMVCTSCTYPAGSKGLVVLAVMDCWRKSFNIRLTGITGLKPGVGLRGRGNALKENGKKKTDPTENDELRRCVCVRARGMFSLETIHSSCKGYWYKNNRLWNISTEKLGALRCLQSETSIQYLKSDPLCACWQHLCVASFACVCVAIFHVLYS